MNLREELERKVQPLYDPKRKPPRNDSRYPHDRDGKRWCNHCLAWHPVEHFKLAGSGKSRGRQCQACRKRLWAERTGK